MEEWNSGRMGRWKSGIKGIEGIKGRKEYWNNGRMGRWKSGIEGRLECLCEFGIENRYKSFEKRIFFR